MEEKNWFWKESPVMWVPMWQYVINYFILLPALIIGFISTIAGACNALAGDYSAFLWGIGLIGVAALVHFILDRIVIERYGKEE